MKPGVDNPGQVCLVYRVNTHTPSNKPRKKKKTNLYRRESTFHFSSLASQQREWRCSAVQTENTWSVFLIKFPEYYTLECVPQKFQSSHCCSTGALGWGYSDTLTWFGGSRAAPHFETPPPAVRPWWQKAVLCWGRKTHTHVALVKVRSGFSAEESSWWKVIVESVQTCSCSEHQSSRSGIRVFANNKLMKLERIAWNHWDDNFYCLYSCHGHVFCPSGRPPHVTRPRSIHRSSFYH